MGRETQIWVAPGELGATRREVRKTARRLRLQEIKPNAWQGAPDTRTRTMLIRAPLIHNSPEKNTRQDGKVIHHFFFSRESEDDRQHRVWRSYGPVSSEDCSFLRSAGRRSLVEKLLGASDSGTLVWGGGGKIFDTVSLAASSSCSRVRPVRIINRHYHASIISIKSH